MSERYLDNFDSDEPLAWSQLFPKPLHASFLERGMPGAFGVGAALHVGAKGLPNTGRYVTSIRLALGVDTSNRCLDLSGFTGVSFWVKGHAGMYNNVLFSIVTPQSEAIDAQPPGDCIEVDACRKGPSRGFSPPEDWARFVIEWRDLSTAWDGLALALQFESQGPDYDIWIDELTFFTGSAPAGKVEPP